MLIRKAPRIIYNDDNCSLSRIPKPHKLEKVVHAVDYLENTQVDCLCWYVAAGIAYSYPSKVLDNLHDLMRNCDDFGLGATDRLFTNLLQEGIDYLPFLISETRKRNISFYASFRMNDVHHKSSPEGALACKFWKEHQDWRLWEVTDGHTCYNAALDYSFSEVRQRYIDAINEVVNNYDIDGIELDFCRNPYLFQPSEAWRKKDILTHFIQNIRKKIKVVGEKHDRPMGLIIRVPFSDRMRRNAGMDVKNWIKNGLMDVLVMTDFENNLNQNVEPWASLCRENDILFYPSTEAGPAILNDRYERIRVRNPLASSHNHVVLDESAEEVAARQRAMAQNYLAQGVDGIYMFNYPCKLFEGKNHRFDDPVPFEIKTRVLNEIGEEKSLLGTYKQFTFWEDLPIHVETLRPPEYNQTISFALRDPSLRTNGTNVTLSFRQCAIKNPHAPGNFEQDSLVPDGHMLYLLNDTSIDESNMRKTKQNAGKISSGFILPEHQLCQITLPGSCFNVGENYLSFHIPRFPKERDPYVYIYELTVDITPKLPNL